MAKAFGQYVERSLCFESFQFLQETLAYATLAKATSSTAASIPEQAQVRISVRHCVTRNWLISARESLHRLNKYGYE
jgi:hypothetical protein